MKEKEGRDRRTGECKEGGKSIWRGMRREGNEAGKGKSVRREEKEKEKGGRDRRTGEEKESVRREEKEEQQLVRFVTRSGRH